MNLTPIGDTGKQVLRFHRLLPSGTVETKLVVSSATVQPNWQKLICEGWVAEIPWRIIERQLKRKPQPAAAPAPGERELTALAARGGSAQ